MHRITGDGYDVQGGKNLYGPEDLPTRNATQVTHMAMNAIQEEIAKVIEAEGGTLNSASEDPLTDMHQLNDAIDNKIKAPRGYIDGFKMYWVGGAGELYIGSGVCLDSTGTKWLRKATAFSKVVINGAPELVTWVAGGGNGGVKSSDLGWWNTDTGSWNGDPTPTNIITGLSDTSGMRVGDHLWASSDKALFGYTWATITGILSGSSITIDRNLSTDGTGVTLTHKGRWFHVFAIGKTTDATAFDIVLASDIDALAGGFGAYDLQRRIGSVFIQNTAGVPAVLLFESFGDDFVYQDYIDTPTASSWPVGGTNPAAYNTVRTLSPRQINTLVKTEGLYEMPAASGKSMALIYRDGGNYGAQARRASDQLWADASDLRNLFRQQDFFTGLGNSVQIYTSGGSASVATATFSLRTIGYTDKRGKDN